MSKKFRHLATAVLTGREASPPKLIVDPFGDMPLEDAYTVQNELVQIRHESGNPQIGYKVGCTSRRIQEQLGIHQPIFGRLFLQDRLESPQTIDRTDFDGLAIEGELAVQLACDPRALSDSRSELEQAINHIFPVIELHHTGNPTSLLNAAVLVANNAIHAGFVQSSTREETRASKPLSMSIHFDRNCVSTIPFEELEHTIFDSLLWLRHELLSIDGRALLTPPVTVLCGSVAELFRVEEATEIKVAFANHDVLRCRVR